MSQNNYNNPPGGFQQPQQQPQQYFVYQGSNQGIISAEDAQLFQKFSANINPTFFILTGVLTGLCAFTNVILTVVLVTNVNFDSIGYGMIAFTLIGSVAASAAGGSVLDLYRKKSRSMFRVSYTTHIVSMLLLAVGLGINLNYLILGNSSITSVFIASRFMMVALLVLHGTYLGNIFTISNISLAIAPGQQAAYLAPPALYANPPPAQY